MNTSSNCKETRFRRSTVNAGRGARQETVADVVVQVERKRGRHSEPARWQSPLPTQPGGHHRDVGYIALPDLSKSAEVSSTSSSHMELRHLTGWKSITHSTSHDVANRSPDGTRENWRSNHQAGLVSWMSLDLSVARPSEPARETRCHQSGPSQSVLIGNFDTQVRLKKPPARPAVASRIPRCAMSTRRRSNPTRDTVCRSKRTQCRAPKQNC